MYNTGKHTGILIYIKALLYLSAVNETGVYFSIIQFGSPLASLFRFVGYISEVCILSKFSNDKEMEVAGNTVDKLCLGKIRIYGEIFNFKFLCVFHTF